MLGLVADQLLGLLVLLIDLVIGLGHHLQLVGPLHGEGLACLDALVALQNGHHHQAADQDAHAQGDDHQNADAHLQLLIHAKKDSGSLALLIPGLLDEIGQTPGHLNADLVAHRLIVVIAHQLLGPAELAGRGEGLVVCRQGDRLNRSGPADLVRVPGLQHQTHGVVFRVH